MARTASAIASKIKSAKQLWKVLGVLDPMDRKQTLILEELETSGKGAVIKDYNKMWNEAFGE